ncbi:hypothetical protein ACNTMW_03390 [Planosporangium sp. 12N6]|uniref:hypothetical protein n=1 Tax=Planosporangium spinosum TaxID=3402278 RepID=UPI003CFA1C08
MAFSTAQYEAAIDKINSGLQDINAKMQQLPPAARAAMDHWYVTQPVADMIAWSCDKVVELASDLLEKLIELLKGSVAPIYMFMYSLDWEDVRGLATGVAGQLKPEALSVDTHWKGAAADAYARQITPQAEAAARIGTVADKTALSLQVCAGAALAFYLALGVIVVKFIMAMVTTLAAYASAVFSWAGLALTIEEASVNTAAILTAVGALLAVLGAQAKEMASLHGEAVDKSAFPGGAWPDATTANFTDATVTDGDADWAFER